MSMDLFASLDPAVSAVGLELVDVEMKAGVLQVTVDRPGGVDLEALTSAHRAIDARLDEVDPNAGKYSIEVSSPGIERTLRTPAHFAKAIGANVSIKTRPQVPGDRRIRGVLVASDDAGFTVRRDDALSPEDTLTLAYGDVDRARTVFVWGGEERPGKAPRAKTAAKTKTNAGSGEPRTSSDTRKEDVTS